MRSTYFNYHYREPRYLSRLTKRIEKIYLSSLNYIPRSHKSSVSCVMYNILRMVKFDYSVCNIILGNSLTKPLPIVNGKIVGKAPSHPNTLGLLNALEAEGLISISKGYRVDKDTRESSYFIITEDLKDLVREYVDLSEVKMVLQEDVLILRDDRKMQVEYAKTQKVREMIQQIKKFNKELRKHRITHRGEVINVALKRIFNSESFKLGGRFYEGQGNVQTLPAEERKHLRIDGEECISLDYSAIHLSIAYSLVGVSWLEGFCPYNVELGDSALVYPDEIQEFVETFSKEVSYNPVRNLIKIAVLVMINAKSTRSAIGAIRNKFNKDLIKVGTEEEGSRIFAGIDPETLNLSEIVEKVQHHNGEVREYFNSGAGTELQFIDSQIMAGILTDLSEAGIIALPIHDSVIVQAKYQDVLLRSMVNNYRVVCGNDHNCRISAKW